MTENLYLQALDDPTVEAEDEFQYMINTTVKTMELIEKKCRKFRTGKVEWSPIAGQARAASRYWKLVVKIKQGKTVCLRSLRNN